MENAPISYFSLEHHQEIAQCIFQPLFGYLCLVFELSIILHFASQILSEPEISGIGLASSLITIFVLAIGHGFNSSLNINVAQALGSQNQELALKYLNITIYTHVIVNSLLGVFIYYSLKLSTFFISKNNQIIVNTASFYSIFTILSSLIFNIYEAYKLFMIANKRVTPFKYIHFITTVNNAFLCYFFAIFLEMGILGLSFPIILTQILNILLLQIYILLYSSDIFKGFSLKFILISQFDFYREFLLISIANVIHFLFDYIFYIILNALAYFLSNAEINAQIALTNTFSFVSQLSECTLTAIQTFVGHELGKGEIKMAKYYGVIGLIQYIVFMSIIQIFLWVFRFQWAHFFATEQEVINQLLITLPYMILWCMGIDGLSMCLGGILKGAEQVGLVSIATIIGYYFISVPLMIYFMVYFQLGLKAIWLGFGFGSFLLSAFYIYKIAKMDWEAQKSLIQEKILFLEEKGIDL